MTEEQQLYENHLISEESYQKIKAVKANPLFSLHWELRTILYVGVVLLTGGLGILVYQNIDTIGHQAVLTAIAGGCAGCFWYCFAKGHPFSAAKHTHESPFFDYVLLLGCLLFLTFEGYLQFQYEVFKTYYQLIPLFPTVLFFILAYRFDHLGILSMAITGLAAWVGISITPLQLIESYEYPTQHLILTGIALGVSLATMGWLFAQRHFKAHFFFTYANFATHLLFVATLSGMFLAGYESGVRYLWFLGLLLVFAATFYFAKQEKSFYFLLIGLLYTYVGFTYVFFTTLAALDNQGEGTVWLGFLYFMGSCAAIVLFITRHKMILARLFSTSDATHEDHL